MVERDEEFYIEDQGDGWWHCASPIRCIVLDGPGPLPGSVDSARSISLLVETDPAIEWNGDPSYAERWGPDHPLCHAIEPTNRLVILAESGSFERDLDRDYSVPATPVTNAAVRLEDVEAATGLGAKVSILRVPSTG